MVIILLFSYSTINATVCDARGYKNERIIVLLFTRRLMLDDMLDKF